MKDPLWRYSTRYHFFLKFPEVPLKSFIVRSSLAKYLNPLSTSDIYNNIYVWVNYNDLTATSLEIMVSKGNHPQMALIQVSEIL